MDQLQGGPSELSHYPFEELEVRGAKDYTIDSNWKILCENFMEWYHVGPIHPNLAKFSTPEQHIDNQGPGKYMSFVTSPLSNSGAVTDLDNFHMTPGHEIMGKHAPNNFDANQTAYFYHLYPNVAVTIYPHSVYTLIMLPQSVGKTFEKLTLLQHPACRLESDSDEKYNDKMSQLLDFVCEVNDEDMEICERLDKGMKQSAYHGGMFSPDMEYTIYRFQNMIADSMTGESPGVYPAVMNDYGTIGQEKTVEESGSPVFQEPAQPSVSNPMPSMAM
jgi:phenylpropionate dioxygenase-like ring-hydroxylating dioxygenase large terminal subunit